jgi:GT2 family glycosyltransferase
MSPELIPVSAVVATRNRGAILTRTLFSLSEQAVQPVEIVIIDASEALLDKRILSAASKLRSKIQVLKAERIGAAVQRNQAMAAATENTIWFFDDDILFERECVSRLFAGLHNDVAVGGVNALIVNQRYQSPGLVSRMMFTMMHGKSEKTFAGKVIGPAINLLPEDRADLPDLVPVEWLNTTCTMYRRDALPNPPFLAEFIDYSLMEDLALSLQVAKEWKIANVRTARIFHDSQAGAHKQDVRSVSAMELVNRHHIMTSIMGKRRLGDYVRLTVWELFSLASTIVSSKPGGTLAAVAGKCDAIKKIVTKKGSP